MKRCSKCKQEKPLDEFRNDKHRKSGKTSRCKACLNTFKPIDDTCYFCCKWFTKKQGNYKFCSRKCHDRYWTRNYRLSVKGAMYQMDYQRRYERKRI